MSSSLNKKDLDVDAVQQELNGNLAEWKGENDNLHGVQENYELDLDKELLLRLKSKRSYISILTERLFQAFDDIQQASRIKKMVKTDLQRARELGIGQPSKGKNGQKEKVVVIGTGWGGHAFLKTIDANKYDVLTISPRNYFMFTPMLAASAVGTVEFRSIIEPIRNTNSLAEYLEATAVGIDKNRKVVKCQSVISDKISNEVKEFEISFDHLLIAAGATTNTFGIKGVREHCLFLKQVEDAENLRKALASCFERANIPNLKEEEIRKFLSFVVVGAGPTGVEFTSELRDWMEVEGKRYYGSLLKYVSITLVEAGKSVLAVFDEALQQEALKGLTQRKSKLIREGFIKNEMVDVKLESGVKEVLQDKIILTDNSTVPYGFVVWAAGNGPIPFINKVIEQIGKEQITLQAQARGRLIIDSWCRVRGTKGIFAIGDCTFDLESPMPATAQVASQQGSYLGRLFSKNFNMSAPTNSAPSRIVILNAKGDENNGGKQIKPISERLGGTWGQIGVPAERQMWADFIDKESTSTNININTALSSDEFLQTSLEYAKPFQFLNLGVLAYLGASTALAQVSVDEKLILGSGPIGFLLWRGIYWGKQVSWRNRILISLDWLRVRIFGRDIGNL